LNFTDDEKLNMFGITSAILNLGNVRFIELKVSVKV
jgi:myosin heavy subunit